MLAALAEENERRLGRQAAMYATDAPLWRRYEQGCDFPEDDLESGYVRILQELIAVGWSTPDVGAGGRELVGGWYRLLTESPRAPSAASAPSAPFTAAGIACLIGNAFLGSEALLLLGFDRRELPVRSALRRVGQLIRTPEEAPSRGRR